jgi:hypothetical protein
MKVIVCIVVAVDKLVNGAWVTSIARKDVDIWWACCYLGLFNL